MAVDRDRDRDRIVEPDRDRDDDVVMAQEDDAVMAPDDDPRVIPPSPDRGGSVVNWLLAILLIVALIIIGILVWAALDDEEDSAGADVGVTVGDVANDTEEYLGVPVTVSGEVNEVIAPTAFTIGGEGFFGGNELLIVGAEGVIALPEGLEREEESVAGGDIVQVTGIVAEFDIAEAEEELGVDLDDELFEEYEGDAAILATNVTTSPRLADLPPSALNIEQIREDTEAFLGEEITLNGEVMELVGLQAFLLQDTSEEEAGVVGVDGEGSLLVIGEEEMISGVIVENVPVVVTGTVVQFAAEDEANLEEEFGFDIEDTLFDTFEDEPVLIATSIEAGAEVDAIDIERIATDALAYVDQQVTTGGSVQEVVTEQAIVLTTEEDDGAVVDVEVLVVGTPDLFAEEIVEDAFVQVTGTVHIFDAEFEEQFADDDDLGFLFEDEAFDDFENGVLIVADSIEVVR